jgi:hypothetical protein
MVACLILEMFAAKALGYVEIIRGFLDPHLEKVDLLHGVSFAPAGSGYDDLTANFTVNLHPFYLELNCYNVQA